MLYTYDVLCTAVVLIIILTPLIFARALNLYPLKNQMSKRAYNNRRDNVFPSTGTRNNTNDHNVNSSTSDRNRKNDSFNDRSNHTSRHCDRSTSCSCSNHHYLPEQSQYINNNFSLQFDCRNHNSYPTDRTSNNINRGCERTDESHRQVEQQYFNSYTDY